MTDVQAAPQAALRVFGGTELTVEGRPITFDTRKAFAVLAYLAGTGVPQPREHLAALLWPDSDPVRGRSALRRTLSVIGRELPGALDTGDGRVALAAGAMEVDVVTYRQLVLAGDAGSARHARALHRGPFLADLGVAALPRFESWVARTRGELAVLHRRLLTRLTDDAVTGGEPAEALALARDRVELDPLDENAQQALVALLARTGDRAEALRQYRRCVALLDRELGVAPLPETVAVYESIRYGAEATRGAPATGPVVDPVAPPSPSGLLSLRGQRAAATAILAAGGGRPASVCVLRGDEGSGRSTVLAQVAAGTGAPVARLACPRGERDLALGSVSALLRSLAPPRAALWEGVPAADRDLVARVVPGVTTDPVPGLPPLAAPGVRERFFRAALDVLQRALPASRWLLIDDAQWLDPSSAELLGYWMRRLDEFPAHLVLALRTDAEPPPAALTAALAASDIGTTLLRPLPPAETAELVDAVCSLAGAEADPVAHTAVHRRSGGVLALALECARALAQGRTELPERTRDLLLARLDSAPATTLQVVAAAAVLGAPADPELLRATSGRTSDEVVDAVEDGLRRGLLTEAPDATYTLRSGALADALLSGTSLARLRLLHGRAADALAQRGAGHPAVAPDTVAQHLRLAGREDDAAAWYRRAADRADRLGGHDEALTRLREAADLGSANPDLHRETARVLVRLGRYGAALAELELAAAGEDEPPAAVEHEIAGIWARRGDLSRAETHLLAALERAGADRALEARASADRARVAGIMGRPEAVATARAAVALARAAGNEETVAHALNALGAVLVGTGERGAGRPVLGEALDTARAAGERGIEVAALNNLARLARADGDLPAALSAAADAVEIEREHGDRHRLAALNGHLADLLHAAGRTEEAQAAFRAAAGGFAAVDDAIETPSIWLLESW